MNDTPTTLSRLITATQTATATDLASRTYLRRHVGKFSVLQGKVGLKDARLWLLGAALLDLHSQASGLPQESDS